MYTESKLEWGRGLLPWPGAVSEFCLPLQSSTGGGQQTRGQLDRTTSSEPFITCPLVQPCVDSDGQGGETSFLKHLGVCTKKVLDEAALTRSPVRQSRTRQPGPQLSWISVYSLVDIRKGRHKCCLPRFSSVYTKENMLFSVSAHKCG